MTGINATSGHESPHPSTDELARTARTRMRRRDRTIVAMIVSAPVLGLAVGLFAIGSGGTRPAPTPRLVALLLVIMILLVGLPLAAFRYRRRKGGDEPALVVGADHSTRKAVRRALRVGQAADPHIDALARDFATRTVRFARVRWVLVGAVALDAMGVVLQLAGGAPWWRDALSVIPVVCMTAGVWAVNTSIRRSRAYLRGAPATDDGER